MASPRSELAQGFQLQIPLVLGTIPFGLLYGTLVSRAGLSAELAVRETAQAIMDTARWWP